MTFASSVAPARFPPPLPSPQALAHPVVRAEQGVGLGSLISTLLSLPNMGSST
jgi:hypothetical protein